MKYERLSEKEEEIAQKIVDLAYIDLPIVYDGLKFDEGLRLDVLVEDLVICELKGREETNPIWEAQILSHLKLTKKQLGFPNNFNVTF